MGVRWGDCSFVCRLSTTIHEYTCCICVTFLKKSNQKTLAASRGIFIDVCRCCQGLPLRGPRKCLHLWGRHWGRKARRRRAGGGCTKTLAAIFIDMCFLHLVCRGGNLPPVPLDAAIKNLGRQIAAPTREYSACRYPERLKGRASRNNCDCFGV